MFLKMSAREYSTGSFVSCNGKKKRRGSFRACGGTENVLVCGEHSARWGLCEKVVQSFRHLREGIKLVLTRLVSSIPKALSSFLATLCRRNLMSIFTVSSEDVRRNGLSRSARRRSGRTDLSGIFFYHQHHLHH